MIYVVFYQVIAKLSVWIRLQNQKIFGCLNVLCHISISPCLVYGSCRKFFDENMSPGFQRNHKRTNRKCSLARLLWLALSIDDSGNYMPIFDNGSIISSFSLSLSFLAWFMVVKFHPEPEPNLTLPSKKESVSSSSKRKRIFSVKIACIVLGKETVKRYSTPYSLFDGTFFGAAAWLGSKKHET